MRLCGDDESDDENILVSHVRRNVEPSSALREKLAPNQPAAGQGARHPALRCLTEPEKGWCLTGLMVSANMGATKWQQSHTCVSGLRPLVEFPKGSMYLNGRFLGLKGVPI